jgi:Ornithine cyclodeaminase/mu-crystallin family
MLTPCSASSRMRSFNINDQDIFALLPCRDALCALEGHLVAANVERLAVARIHPIKGLVVSFASFRTVLNNRVLAGRMYIANSLIRQSSSDVLFVYNENEPDSPALIFSNQFSALKTAATNLLLAQHLLATANKVALIGTGRQALAHALFLHEMMSDVTICLYSRSFRRRTAFLAALREYVPRLRCDVALSVHEAMADAEAVITGATSKRRQNTHGNWSKKNWRDGIGRRGL